MRFFFIILLSLLIIDGCSHKMDEAANGDADPCSNAIGNGNEIISGPAGPGVDDFDQVFRSLEVDPSNSDVIYVGTERNGIVKSTDAGKSWQRLRRGMRHSADAYPEVWDIAVSPFDSSLVIAATLDSPGPIAGNYPSSVAGVYRSTDGGTTWARSNCGLSNSYAVSVRFDPDNKAGAVLGIGGGKATFSDMKGQAFNGALLYSNDGGLNWNAASTPAGADVNVFWIIRALGSGTSRLVTFGFRMDDLSNNLGFLRSENGGRVWSPFASSLRMKRITAFDVSIDGRILVAIERDAFSMLKSSDGGLSWNTLAIPANGPIKMSPADPDIVIFCESEKVYCSTSGLNSYSAVLTAMDRVDDIEFAPSKPNIAYLATRGYTIYRSTNSGASWSHLVNLRTAGVLK